MEEEDEGESEKTHVQRNIILSEHCEGQRRAKDYYQSSDVFGEDFHSKIVEQVDARYHCQWPSLPVIHEEKFDLSESFRLGIITKKEEDFLLKKSIKNNFFYYNVTIMLTHLPPVVVQHILTLVVGYNSLKQAIFLSKVNNMCKQFRKFRNFKGFESAWEIFLSKKENKPQKYYVISHVFLALSKEEYDVYADDNDDDDDGDDDDDNDAQYAKGCIFRLALSTIDIDTDENLVKQHFANYHQVLNRQVNSIHQLDYYSLANWTTIKIHCITQWYQLGKGDHLLPLTNLVCQTFDETDTDSEEESEEEEEEEND